ncbi:MAG TPA: amidase, partial [Roseiarcus sp.]
SSVAAAALPAISAPVGLVAGAPAGVQILAAPFCEARCLGAAAALERRIGQILPLDPPPA